MCADRTAWDTIRFSALTRHLLVIAALFKYLKAGSANMSCSVAATAEAIKYEGSNTINEYPGESNNFLRCSVVGPMHNDVDFELLRTTWVLLFTAELHDSGDVH